MHILLATDGSPDGNTGAMLLSGYHAGPDDLVTVVVVTPSGYFPGADLKAPPGAAIDRDEDVAETLAAVTAQPLEEAGYQVAIELRHGDPAEEIIIVARETGADLLVLGQRGLGVLRRMLIGSVAASVARQATSPVLLMTHPASFARLLIVSDNTPASSRAAEIVLRIPASNVEHATFLQINQAGPEGEAIAAAFHDAAVQLEETGIAVEFVETTGNEVDVALEHAQRQDATLIVAAASNATVDGDPVLGTTVHGIFERASCSILVAR